MATSHFRNHGHYNFNGDDPDPTAMGITYQLDNVGETAFLYRSRMFLEFRIAAYSQTDSDQPADEWWDNIQCFAGLEYIIGPVAPLNSSEPIGGANGETWVQWEQLTGSVESMVTTPAGWHRWTYAYRLAGGISESFAKRSPQGLPNPTSWIAWNFVDQNDYINRTHASFDVVYDLQVNYAVDQFFQYY